MTRDETIDIGLVAAPLAIWLAHATLLVPHLDASHGETKFIGAVWFFTAFGLWRLFLR